MSLTSSPRRDQPPRSSQPAQLLATSCDKIASDRHIIQKCINKESFFHKDSTASNHQIAPHGLTLLTRSDSQVHITLLGSPDDFFLSSSGSLSFTIISRKHFPPMQGRPYTSPPQTSILSAAALTSRTQVELNGSPLVIPPMLRTSPADSSHSKSHDQFSHGSLSFHSFSSSLSPA
eukprot:762475-Hanusia_phi.AAC.2